jgi:hypothetical protein
VLYIAKAPQGFAGSPALSGLKALFVLFVQIRGLSAARLSAHHYSHSLNFVS